MSSFLGMNKIRKTPDVLDSLIVLLEESIAADDDNVCRDSIMADKDIFEFVQSLNIFVDRAGSSSFAAPDKNGE
ncbi:hypothetical protein TNCV_3627101 [Trichonephila clavipes]|nr:hypothetical protein TNCV_3627101 [Trichonephila clavipes]